MGSDPRFRKTTWWLRVVGTFYLLLVAMNVVFLATGSNAIRDSIPFTVDDNGLHAFIDAWFTFVLALFAIAVVALYASTRPSESRILVLAVVAGELAFGIGGDVWLIARGYDAGSYIAFSVLHLAIVVTGILLLRGELATPHAPHPSAATAPSAAA